MSERDEHWQHDPVRFFPSREGEMQSTPEERLDEIESDAQRLWGEWASSSADRAKVRDRIIRNVAALRTLTEPRAQREPDVGPCPDCGAITRLPPGSDGHFCGPRRTRESVASGTEEAKPWPTNPVVTCLRDAAKGYEAGDFIGLNENARRCAVILNDLADKIAHTSPEVAGEPVAYMVEYHESEARLFFSPQMAQREMESHGGSAIVPLGILSHPAGETE